MRRDNANLGGSRRISADLTVSLGAVIEAELLSLPHRRAAPNHIVRLGGADSRFAIDRTGGGSTARVPLGRPGRLSLSACRVLQPRVLVPLRAHVGAMAPFQVWVHTHPRFDAYWSATDRQSLANGAGVLNEALVLGFDGVKRARNLGANEPDTTRIGGSPALDAWSQEDPAPWPSAWPAGVKA